MGKEWEWVGSAVVSGLSVYAVRLRWVNQLLYKNLIERLS